MSSEAAAALLTSTLDHRHLLARLFEIVCWKEVGGRAGEPASTVDDTTGHLARGKVSKGQLSPVSAPIAFEAALKIARCPA